MFVIPSGIQSPLVQVMAQRQVITWNNDDLLSTETNFNEIWIKMQLFSSKKIRLKMSFAQNQSFCSVLNMLI